MVQILKMVMDCLFEFIVLLKAIHYSDLLLLEKLQLDVVS